ncbi:MAG TPA: heme-binding protein [Gammaproteobacteria bacterium]|nr:heme-binding protein [Gammaproteobacteria bacterium]
MTVGIKQYIRGMALIAILAHLLPVSAQDSLATYKMLKTELALEVAQEALKACREGGFQTAVAIVDRAGIVQVMLRDQLAGSHTVETARRKAWTAASFKGVTSSIAEATQPGSAQSGVRFVTEAIMLGGGVPLYAEGALIGALGVSGAPSGEEDEKCAQKGADFLLDRLLF